MYDIYLGLTSVVLYLIIRMTVFSSYFVIGGALMVFSSDISRFIKKSINDKSNFS